MPEARKLMSYIASFDPDLALTADSVPVSLLLKQRRPDRRQTVLIVLGNDISAQIADYGAAEVLRQAVDQRVAPGPDRWAAVVTEGAIAKESRFAECALIAIGGPMVNPLTAGCQSLATDHRTPTDSHRLQVWQSSHEQPRMCVWGLSAGDTNEAARAAISSGALDEFLELAWKPRG